MKLLASINDTHCVFSVGHYDYRTYNELMADGGQKGCTDYSGYTRFRGKTAWIELPGVSFADLYNDYQFAGFRPDWPSRKYGIHKLEDVRILDESEWPDNNSFEWRVQNAVWGTYGKNGDEPKKYIHLVDADTEHLQKIYDISSIRGTIGDSDTLEITKYILNQRGIDIDE